MSQIRHDKTIVLHWKISRIRASWKESPLGSLFSSVTKIYVKIPRKCHNHEAQSSRGTKRRRDEEQLKTKQMRHMKPQTHNQRKTATEEPPWNGQYDNYLGALTSFTRVNNFHINSITFCQMFNGRLKSGRLLEDFSLERMLCISFNHTTFSVSDITFLLDHFIASFITNSPEHDFLS